LHFSDFSTIFNDFSKVQLKPKNTITSRAMGKTFHNLHNSPWFTENTLGRLKKTQSGPRRQ
jgi:hypothetical protein